MCYLPGDTIGILAENADSVINEIINRNDELRSKCCVAVLLRLSASSASQKKPSKMPVHLPPGVTTISKLLKEAVDLNAIPKKAFLAALVRHGCVSDATEKRFLEILASREGSTHYVSQILQAQKSFVSIFHDLKSMAFNLRTIGLLLEHLPRLMPRPYSISMSPLMSGKHRADLGRDSTLLKIIFSVNEPPGITTRMLEQRIFKYQVNRTLTLDMADEVVSMFFRQSNRFRLSDDDFDRSVILIAIGTGLAPFIGFLEHRQESMKKHNRKCGPTWLIFGCRRKAKQLCANEIQQFARSGALSDFDEAFSRDIGAQEKYVQDVIACRGEAFVERLVAECDGKETKTFVCGSKKMTQDVRSAIEACLLKYAGQSETEAKATIDGLVKNGRYIEDIWI